MWRGGLGVAYLFPPLSSGGASIAAPCSVSTSRSSNRTCGFPASGSPTDVAFRHTLPALPGQLHLKPKLALESPHLLLEEVIGLRHSPDRCPLHKHIRSQAPSLHRHYPDGYYEPVRHPTRPGLSLTGVRLVSIHHRWGFPCCVGSPCIRAFAITPAGPMRALLSFSNDGGLPRSMSAPALPFSRPAQRSLHVSARILAEPFGFGDVVNPRSGCYRLQQHLPGGTLTHWSSAPFHGAPWMDGMDRIKAKKREKTRKTEKHENGNRERVEAMHE